MKSAAHSASLPYLEPEIVTILVQSSFLLLLNAVNYILDTVVYCGLIGQIFLGIAWGTPGAKWLETNVEDAIVQLGYLGLLLLVYEGGLSTSVSSLKANIWLSLGVAVTGIGVPFGLSFILQRLTNATPIQCFAAGASLCSTSLGTTFTVLRTSGLVQSRLGVVLTSAAMMDDVVGLVLVQVLANIGQTRASITIATIVRPLLVSVAFVVVAPLICVLVAKPITGWLNRLQVDDPNGRVDRALRSSAAALSIHTLILLGSVAGASYAGTSNLFAAYIAGASISWWDSTFQHDSPDHVPGTGAMASNEGGTNTQESPENETSSAPQPVAMSVIREPGYSGLQIYERYYAVAVNRILRPFFFASIGFSIPVTEMFAGDIIWKGLVYAVLMIVAKLVCGFWLLRLSLRLPVSAKTKQSFHIIFKSGMKRLCARNRQQRGKPAPKQRDTTRNASSEPVTNSTQAVRDLSPSNLAAYEGTTYPNQQPTIPRTSKPRSIYPASIIGCAMVARGEIGFLISSIAESNGVFATTSERDATSNIFLIVTWAVVICTFLGPLAVGILVQRVKKLQHGVQRNGQVVHRDVLGAWGVS